MEETSCKLCMIMLNPYHGRNPLGKLESFFSLSNLLTKLPTSFFYGKEVLTFHGSDTIVTNYALSIIYHKGYLVENIQGTVRSDV